MIRILIADDDPNIRTIIREYSQAEDWEFAEAENGEEALEKFGSENFALIVLDVMMPGTDGWGVLKQVRKTSRVPAILLTARNEEYDRLLGFELGVDDYVGKPFSPRELVARIKALLKRAGQTEQGSESYAFEGLVVDTNARVVKADDKEVNLTPKEYDLLALFVSRPGIVFTRDQLLNRVWGYDYYGDARTVDTHIKGLREKLGKYRDLIVTVWGTGYRFTGGTA